jgi:hypothetical protein
MTMLVPFGRSNGGNMTMLVPLGRSNGGDTALLVPLGRSNGGNTALWVPFSRVNGSNTAMLVPSPSHERRQHGPAGAARAVVLIAGRGLGHLGREGEDLDDG